MEELLRRSVNDLALLLRDAEVSARELTEAALRRVERVDGAINAFVDADAERALAEADALPARAPLAGVPVAIKANVPVEGRPMHMASRFLADFRAPGDAYLVRRLREAGFVVIGMTNLPEFGILPTTEPRFGGPTRNPWDLDRTPGGSSGGSAAAVAGGMVPVAHGNDGGGSIRIPAACCHLVGLKPSRGRISRGPQHGDAFLVADGVLTRTVADTALLLDVLAGYEAGDATWAPLPGEAYGLAVRREPGRLRVAVSLENGMGVEIHEENRRAVREAAELLTSLGHEVTEADPPVPGEETRALFAQVFCSAIAVGPAFGAALAGRPPGPDDIEPLSAAVFERASRLPAHGYLTAVLALQRLARRVVAFFADYDVLLTPALAERPLRIGELHGCGSAPLEDFARSAAFTPYTALFNVTGQPAMSVPMGLGADRLPTAVQLVGRPLAEDLLLRLAAQIEAARPWADVQPPEPVAPGPRS